MNWEEKVFIGSGIPKSTPPSRDEIDSRVAAALDVIRQTGVPLGKAILRLDHEKREVIALRLVGLSSDEIAEILSYSLRGVRRLIDAARVALRDDDDYRRWQDKYWALEVPADDGGQIVVCDLQDMMEEIARRPTELLKLTPRRFEEMVAEIWKRFGYEVELTKRTRDGGYDIIAILSVPAKVKFLIECKRYAFERKIDVSIVRALYGVKTQENATKGILAATCPLSRSARDFVNAREWELEAHDQNDVIGWIKKASRGESLLI